MSIPFARRHEGRSLSFRELLLALVLFLAGVVTLHAQTNLETNAGVYFNFSTPGAGNLGLGGAFLALAFDASAAYTNPAGLTTIAAPETLVEVRHWNYTHLFTDRGGLEADPQEAFGFGDHEGLIDGTARNQVTGLSFISYVYPRRNWSFALYRHELVNFQAEFSTQGAFLDLTRQRGLHGIPGEHDGRLAALRNHMDLDIRAYGGAAGWHLSHGLSLGLAVSYFDFDINSLAERFRQGEFLAPPNFTVDPVDPLVNFQMQQGEDSDWSFAAGFLWESPQKKWNVGGVFRQGPDFDFQARSQSGPPPADFELPRFAFQETASFHVPDFYGVGIAYRPRDTLRLAFDYDRVRYSQLLQGFVDIFNLAELPQPADSPCNPNPDEKHCDPELNRFKIDDTRELHFGVEYAFLQHWPVLTLRTGGWSEPDHSLRFEGNNVGFSAVFRRRADQLHYTAGVGLALRRLQLDAAVDYSDRVSVISLSAGIRY